MKMCQDQLNLFYRIMAVSFILDDLILFLDTHPDNECALREYHENHHLYKELVHKYSTTYGPLTAKEVNNKDRFTWTDGPWPWEVNC